MKKPLLKIYGERNTGTNYLHKLITLNLDVDLVPGVVPGYIMALQSMFPGEELVRDAYFYMTFHKNLGWKHSLVKSADHLKQYPICSNNLFFLTITKNPYSWLVSLYRRPYHLYQRNKQDFQSFVTHPWRTVGRDNAGRAFSTPVEMWNKKNLSYMELKDHFPTLNLKYEDLLSDHNGTLEQIRKAISCEQKHSTFVNIDRSTKDRGKDFLFYRKYYLEEQWREKLSPGVIRIINEGLDDKILNFFQYEKLE